MRKWRLQLPSWLAVGVVAWVLRAALVAWAATRFPPAGDGKLYHILAQRIASGAGYSWAWPDGVVTPVAHYPVGYPALLGALYSLFGATPSAMMWLQAATGSAAAAAAAWILSASYGSQRRACIAGLLVALHPALLWYTPALMTEGLVGDLLLLSLALAQGAVLRRTSSAGHWVLWGGSIALLALAGFFRPQLALLAPVWVLVTARRSMVSVLGRAVAAAALFAAIWGPWTWRNCQQMDQCVTMSANGGWNLYIGAADGATGSWVPLERLGVPPECREVFPEVAKDRCFGAAAQRVIRQHPLAWVALMPAKLDVTFRYCGAANWYLHEANAEAWPDSVRWVQGSIETLWMRLIYAFGGWAAVSVTLRALRAAGRRVPLVLVWGLPVLAAALWFVPQVTPAVVCGGAILLVGGVVALAGMVGPSRSHLAKVPPARRRAVEWRWRRLALLPRGPVAWAAPAALLLTAVTHAVFFGAGRYSLPLAGLLCVLAASASLPGPRGSSWLGAGARR